MRLIDTHAHLDLEQYDHDRQEVCSRAASDLEAVINVGISAKTTAECLRLSRQYANFYTAVGIHPNNAEEYTEEDWKIIVQLAHDPKAIAIGETGFDLFHGVSLERQRELFIKHLQLAHSLDKPLIIHCRAAASELTNFLRQRQNEHTLPDGVVHCFTEDIETAERYLRMGFYIALGGVVTFKQATALVPMVKYIPAERLLLETDCPFLAPQVFRGQRNEPSYIIETAKIIAQIRGVNLEELTEQTTQNSRRLFKI